jgi:formiminoglutamase
MILQKLYCPGTEISWTGRIDDPDDDESFRWHQIIKGINLNDNLTNLDQGISLLGFCSDEGVKRNKGRTGAAKGPEAIRHELTNLPYGFSGKPTIYDAGNIIPEVGKLEEAQAQLANAVQQIKELGLFPVVLGGGHEIAYGHYNGLKAYFKKHIGIFNMDAHFDIRPYHEGGSSGTMFRQISDDCKSDNELFSYMVMGIQTYANTVSLFKKADELNIEYVLAKEIVDNRLNELFEKINVFSKTHEHIYLTFCTDVISSAFAPGVSATQPFGIEPEIVLRLLKHLLNTGKVASFDFAEVSPRFDDDHQTAKLVAVMIYAMVNTLEL